MNQHSPRTVLHLFIIGLLPLFIPLASAQEGTVVSPWVFLPEEGPFLQLPANPEEPRTGIRKEAGSSRMRLDVGTGFELLELNCSPDDQFRLGLIIFAYALTTNNQGLRLQIDALDGFFGGHITYRKKLRDLALLARLRILHRSAHFVDGHIDPDTGMWLDGRAPIPFTRDFGEIVGAADLSILAGQVKIFSGISYATLVRPTDIKRFGALFGLDYRTHDSFSTLFGHPLLLYGAYQLGLTGIPAYVGTSIVEGGVKLGRWDGNGVRVFVSYNSGLEVFGQYYNIKRSFWYIGFTMDIL